MYVSIDLSVFESRSVEELSLGYRHLEFLL